MKKIILLIFISLSLLCDVFSQCTEFSCSISDADKNRLYDFSNDQVVSLDFKIDTIKYSKVFVNVYQVVGLRPVKSKQYELTRPTLINFPISYVEADSKHFLLIRFSDKAETKDGKYLCVDTIKILEGYKLNAFWRSGVKTSYKVSIDNELIKNEFVDISRFSIDSIQLDTIYSTDESLNATFKVVNDSKMYEFWIRTPYKSKNENLEVYIYPNAMTTLKVNYGIDRLEKISALSEKDRLKIINKYPQYEKIFDPNLTLKLLKGYDTKHIIIYRMRNNSGVHFVGADNIN